MQELMNYQSRKEDIRKRLRDIVDNFVYIGYQLRQVQENKEYEQDGYSDIVEFAGKEYGLSSDDTYRFIRINTRYSIGGNSAELDEPFKGIAQSKLSEMLNLPDEDLPLITSKTKREDIRELNRFNKQEPEEVPEAAAGAVQEIIMEFFRPAPNRPEAHDMLQQLLDIEKGIVSSQILSKEELIQECINPNGNGTFRKGRYILFLYDAREGMKYKVFGDNQNYTITYGMFAKTAHLLFCMANPLKDNMDEWESCYGKEPEPEPIPEIKLEQEQMVPELPEKSEKKPPAKSSNESKGDSAKIEKAVSKDTTQAIRDEVVDKLEILDKSTESEESYPQKEPEKAVVAPAQLEKPVFQEDGTEIITNPYKELKNIVLMSVDRILEDLDEDNFEAAYKAGKNLMDALEDIMDVKRQQDDQIDGQMDINDFEA